MTGTSRSEATRINYVWAIACVLTVVSAIATAAEGGGHATTVGLAVVAIAVVKAGLILGEFMEIRTAPRWLRWFGGIWLTGLTAAIVVLYLQ